MTHPLPTRRRIVLAAAAASTAPLWAHAEDRYPSKPIRIVVPFGAGGSPDVYSRILAAELQRRTGLVVTVENRSGANSMLGTHHVAKGSPADGYTILYGTNSGLSAARAMVRSVPYDPTGDLAGVAMVGDSSFVLVTRAQDKVTLAELVRLMRERPGEYEIGGASVTTKVVDGMLSTVGKLDHLYVPYKENARMLNELMAGEIRYGFSPIPSAVKLIETGKIVPIAVTGPARVAALPDVPSLSEELPGVALTTWTGYFVAAKTPRHIVDYLHRTLSEINDLPELRGITEQSGRPLRMKPHEIDAFVKNDEKRWVRLFRDAGIQPE